MNRRDFAALLTTPLVSNARPITSLARSAPVIRPPSADFIRQIPRLMETAEVPGIAACLVQDRRVVWDYGHGVANVREGRPVSADTLWVAASLGKPVLALAALRLVDEGRLELDRPLRSYLPEYTPDDRRGNLITARHVLSHSSGLPNWRGGPDDRLVPAFEPGARFQYSGEGFFYLQCVVEKIAGAGFEQCIQERLFAPLGMTSSTYSWQADTVGRIVAGHDRGNQYSIFWQDLAEKLLRHAEQVQGPLASLSNAEIRAAIIAVAPTARTLPQFVIPNSAASLLTTASDYGKFLVAAMDRAPAPVNLRPDTRRAMFTQQIPVNSTLGWGLGWGTDVRSGTVWQWGDNDSWKNFVLAHPESRTALVIFTNASRGLNVARNIVHASLGREHPAFLWL